MKKIISVFICSLIAFQGLCVNAFSGVSPKPSGDFVITNPYKDVEFGKWKAYKAQLHCHTTASDGFLKIKDALKKYYDLDYDIIAFTDHGTNNLGWNKVPQTVPLMREIKKERSGGAYAPIEPLTDEEYEAYLYGTAKPSEGITRTNDSGMVDVALGNELNLATPFADCHLTHYWSDYGQGLAGVYGDYETPSRETALDGGVIMFSHIGEYVYTDKDSYNYVGQPVDEYYVNKFARICLDYPVGKYKGCVAGTGINSATDAHTRCDRILYDSILRKTVPNGVVPWGFTFSDSHNETSMNDAYTMMLIPNWSGKNNGERNDMLRKCMENGEFFSVSHYAYGVELDGEPEWPESYNDGVDVDVDAMNMKDTPMVTDLVIDEEKDTITVTAEHADRIVWVSDGNVIKREKIKPDGDEVTFTIDLHDSALLNKVNLFLRFYLTGDEGICYSQPFVIHNTDSNGKIIEFEPVDVPKTHDISTFLRGLVTALDWTIFKWNPVIWAFKYFGMGYSPFDNII